MRSSANKGIMSSDEVPFSIKDSRYLKNGSKSSLPSYVLAVFDAIGISFFTILGVQKSLNYESNTYAAIIFGMFTAVCGGMTRDVLLNETPLIFKKEVYATACLGGGLTYILLVHLDLDISWAAFI